MIKGWLGAKLTNFLEEWDYFPAMFNFEYPSFLSLPVSYRLQTHQSQRGSRINTDRFPKQVPKGHASRRFRGNALQGNVKKIKNGFLSRSDRVLSSSILLRWSLATWKDFSPLKMFIMKSVTDFRKTVETGVDPCLKAFLVSGSWRTYLDRKTDIITRKLCGYITFIDCSTVVLFWTSCQKQ